MYMHTLHNREYVKETRTASTLSENKIECVSRWKTWDLGELSYVKTIEITYNVTSQDWTSGEDSGTDYFAGDIAIEGSNDNANWKRLGTLTKGTLTVNGTWRYIRMVCDESDSTNTWTWSCVISHTISYDKVVISTGTASNYTYYIDKFNRHVMKLKNDNANYWMKLK